MFYETFRPETFKQMVGRDKEISTVLKHINSVDGMCHYLLSGQQGTGKTTFAFATAREALKEDYKGNFFEFNGSDIGVEMVRKEIVEIAKRRPFEAKYKIILIDEADKITPDAQGAFRRVLEKYEKNTKFIFTANYPNKLIPPLVSRFIHFRFEKIGTKDIAMYLKRCIKKMSLDNGRFVKVVKTDKELVTIAKMSNGDLRMAFGILEGETPLDTTVLSLSIAKISKMTTDEKVNLAFKTDAELLFNILWEMVQKEKDWKKLKPMADCSVNMNSALHKTLFIANLLESHF